MKAYAVHSWGDTEYFLNRDAAIKRLEEVTKEEDESDDLSEGHKEIKCSCDEIEIVE